MTLDDLKKQGGYKIIGYTPDAFANTPVPPKKTALESISGGFDSIFGGKQIGESLVKAGTNVKNLVTGGVSKFNAGLPQNTVNVPALIGDYTKAATTAVSPGVGGGLVGEATPGLLGGVLHGAKIGALAGGAEGAIQGGANAAKNQEGFGGVATAALEGGVGGALAGGVLGGVVGGGAGALKSRNIANANFAETFSSPKETPTIKAQAIQQGRFTDPGLFRAGSVEPSVKDSRLADSVRDVVSPRNSLSKNVNAVNHKISTVNNGVKTFIENNKTPFNANQLRARLMGAKADSKLVFASDATAEKTYNAVVDAFMDTVGKKDTAGLFEARQNFDKIPAIKKLLDSRALGENVKKSIVLDVRRAANEYIADQLPEGNTYRDQLRQESHMIEALGNAAEKGAHMIGKNGIQLLTEKYPILKWIVGTAIGAGGVGVGGALIGSSD